MPKQNRKAMVEETMNESVSHDEQLTAAEGC